MKHVQHIKKNNLCKIVFFALLSILIGCGIFILFGEIILRMVPIRGVAFNTSIGDNKTGVVYYPDAIMNYQNKQGKIIKRKVNRWGYLDIDHEQAKKKGVFRIGFFGDSFTEARQVPIEETFFRKTEAALSEYKVEAQAFGISGYSTLQSYLTSNKYTNFFNIDMVVYVFCENDIGDQIYEISFRDYIPHAILTDNGFIIDNSFRERVKYKNNLFYKVVKYLTSKSLLATTLSNRIKLLLQHGIKINLTEEERSMAVKPENKLGNIYINQVSLPSLWPETLRNYAIKLEEHVLLQWKKEVEDSSRRFAILYIPRESEWQKPTQLQDSWKRWLKEFCKSEKIDFIDPTESFLVEHNMGKKLFDDHFTAEGHRAFANAFIQWFKLSHELNQKSQTQ